MTAAVAIPPGPSGKPDRFRPPATRVTLVIANLLNRGGGAERIFVELANMLVARGYAVSCVHFEDAEGAPFYPLDRRIELINVHPRFRSERRWPYNMFKSKRLPDRVRNWAEWHLKKDPVIGLLRDYFRHSKPDVAISFLPPANTPTLLAAAGTDVKVIPTNHNVPERDYCDPKRWSTNPYDRVMRMKALRHAAAIHVLFADFGAWFPQRLQDKIVVVANYISKDVLRHQPGDRENTILGVGRLAPVKNYLMLADAWALIAARHPDWRVVIYGDGPQQAKLEERIAELGIDDSFALGGTRSDMGEVYARAEILCHPAEFEGFGLAPAEALALKMPVVAFADCPGVNQFVVDGVNGLLADRSGGAEALAAALERLIDDRDLRQRLGDNGPASVATFTEEHFADAWVELIERCLGKR
ncbi:glycosyltransferase [Bauldia litoralis]|uniref:glycosyltransferase n=2 Tax=Bauldia litoralis TaxID=665467 RepID=UPI003265EB58